MALHWIAIKRGKSTEVIWSLGVWVNELGLILDDAYRFWGKVLVSCNVVCEDVVTEDAKEK